MIKRFALPLILITFAYLIISNENLKIITAGIAIFIIGMHFMESGFKLFSGGTLEKVLAKFTKNKFTSVLTGFLSTSVVQSSSLISVIVISFLTVGLISLTQGIAVIFGANLGSTTTAWIVSSFGLKIKISLYAMPMIIFGVIFRFSNDNKYIGLGNVLLGLGFIFLGIAYMKDGFDSLRESIDLAAYSVPGFAGLLLYILIGAVATVVIQSSSATMAIIITALAGGNILYTDALALAIGANVGTTVTAILGALTSNHNGKRLAFGHFVFNILTGLIALSLIFQLQKLVDFIAPYLAIASDDFAMKLALFHTIFNLIGIVVLFPFIGIIVVWSKKLITEKTKKASKPIYLDDSNIKIPYNAMISIKKEIIHLYENTQKAVLHASGMHTTGLNTEDDVKKSVLKPSKIDTNLDDIYQNDIKSLYSQIIEFSLISQKDMNDKQIQYVSDLQRSSRMIIEVLKDTRDLQKNFDFYIFSKNEHIKNEYIDLKKELAINIVRVNNLKDKHSGDNDDLEISTLIQTYKDKLQKLDFIHNGKIDELIRSGKITPEMATSLINDSNTIMKICANLYKIANILFINDEKLRFLGEVDEDIKTVQQT